MLLCSGPVMRKGFWVFIQQTGVRFPFSQPWCKSRRMYVYWPRFCSCLISSLDHGLIIHPGNVVFVRNGEDMQDDWIAIVDVCCMKYCHRQSWRSWRHSFSRLRLSICSAAAAANRDLLSLSAKTRILQLRSRQIDHSTTVCKVGDLEYTRP